MILVRPAREHVASYAHALAQGWSPDTRRGADCAREELEALRTDEGTYLQNLVDREARGPAIRLPDGSQAKRLPGYRLWLWDGEFCGGIGLRWRPGTTDLPATCSGHIGYSVVPWKRRLGYATKALALMLPMAKAEGLPFVHLSTDPDNESSQRVILANGGVFVERYAESGGREAAELLRFRIDLAGVTAMPLPE